MKGEGGSNSCKASLSRAGVDPKSKDVMSGVASGVGRTPRAISLVLWGPLVTQAQATD